MYARSFGFVVLSACVSKSESLTHQLYAGAKYHEMTIKPSEVWYESRPRRSTFRLTSLEISPGIGEIDNVEEKIEIARQKLLSSKEFEKVLTGVLSGLA